MPFYFFPTFFAFVVILTHFYFIYSSEESLYQSLKDLQPNVRFLGDDYIGKRFTGDHLPIEVVYTTRSHGWSTTKIKDLITIQTLKQNPEIINLSKND